MTLYSKLVCSCKLCTFFVFIILALFSAGGIMANLDVALIDWTMAIAMLSGLHVPAVVKQECVVDYWLSAEKQRYFNSSGQAMISRKPVV